MAADKGKSLSTDESVDLRLKKRLRKRNKTDGSTNSKDNIHQTRSKVGTHCLRDMTRTIISQPGRSLLILTIGILTYSHEGSIMLMCILTYRHEGFIKLMCLNGNSLDSLPIFLPMCRQYRDGIEV